MPQQDVRVAYCPHCGNTAPQHLIHTQRYLEALFKSTGEREKEDASWSTFITACSTCGKVLLYDNPGDEAYNFTTCELVYPKNAFLSIFIPEKIRAAYAEASRVREVSPTAFAVMIRRSLEIVCNDRGLSAGNLAKRIKILSDRGEIPPVLSQATDLLRLIGNIAAHGSEQSVHALQVRAIDDFFMAVIEYLYIAPRRISDFERRLRGVDDGNSASEEESE
jgi:hypothetical protein